MVHVASISGRRWPTFDGMHRMGPVVSYSFREAATLVAWVREEGDYILWYCSGPPGVVAPWIGEAMAVEGWSWTASD